MNYNTLEFLKQIHNSKQTTEVILNLGPQHSLIFSHPQFASSISWYLIDNVAQFLDEQLEFWEYEKEI